MKSFTKMQPLTVTDLLKVFLLTLGLALIAAYLVCPGKLQPAFGEPAIPLSGKVSKSAGNTIDPAEIRQAVDLFKAKRYSDAFRLLDSMPHKGDRHDQVHYYMGLCLQYMNQVAPAKEQFQWVYHNSTDQRLRYNAQLAWSNLSYYQGHRTYEGQGNDFDRGNRGPSRMPLIAQAADIPMTGG